MPDTPPRAPQLASRFGPAPAFTQPPPLSGLAYDAAVLADAPVLYVTGTAADVSGHGHTVSAVGSPTTAAVLPNGDPGWSLDASGTQYLRVADADDLSVVTTGTLTVECWVAPSAVNQPNAKNTQYVNFLSKAGFQPVPGSNQNEWELRYFSANTTDPGNSGESYCGYASTSLGATSFTGNDDTVGVTPGQWAHLVVVYTATTVTIYRDGRQVNTATFSGVPQNGTAPVTIGAGQISESDASFWYGAIGKVAVYSTALSAARITAHYMAMGLQVSVPVLVNTAEGGSGGTTVTNNNSGGLSGHPWDSVTIGTGATVVFDKAHTVHGRFSVNLAQPSGVASSAFLQWGSSAIGAQRTVWFRFYLYLTAYPTANVRVFTGVQTASLCGALLLLTTGQLLATDSLGGTSFTFTGSVPLNQHVRVEGFLTGDAATGQWEVRQFNTADSLTANEVQTSAANQNTTGPLNIYRFGFASTTTQTPAFTSWWDDLGLSAAGYLGPSPAGQFLVPVPYPVPNTPWMSPLASRFGPARPFQLAAAQPAVRPVTVTAAQAASPAAGMGMVLKVLTGAAAVQNGTVVASDQPGQNLFGVSITPSATGSRVYGAFDGFFKNDWVPFDSNTAAFLQDTSNGASGLEYIACKSAALTTAATPVVVGCSSPTANGVALFLAEILAAGTLAEDASAPPPVPFSATTAVTTGAFTPPPGAVLVLMVSANGGAGSNTLTVSDSSGLTWAELGKSNVAGHGYVGIWTAAVPGGAAPVATVRSSSTYASAATEASFSVPLPAGFAAGDVCYLFAEGRAASGAFGAAPSGWTAVAASFPSGASTSSFMVCYRKVMAGGEGNPTVTGTSGRYSAVCVAVQGADNTTPEDVAVVTDNGGASAITTITSPGVTPAGANDLLLTGFGCGTPASGTAINYTTPAGMSLVAAVATTVAAVTESGMMVASQALTSSAATGTDQTTITPSAIDGQTVTIGVRTASTGPVTAAANLAAAGTVAALVTQDAGTSTSLAGAGAVAAVATVIPAAMSLTGAGAVSAVAAEIPAAMTLAGAAAVTDVVTQGVIASPAGAGSVTDVVTQIVTANLAGAGAVTAKTVQAVTASPAGAAAVTDVVTQAVTGSLAGAGAISATATTPGGAATATIAGAGAVTALATQAVTASLAGAGAVTANVTQAATANLAGAGALAANVVQAATSNAVAAGAVTANVTQAAKATAAGAGAVNATGIIAVTGTAALAAAGAVNAKATQAALAAITGASGVTSTAAQGALASLAGAGSLTAASTVSVAFTVGALTAATAPAATLTTSDAPGGITGGTLTATDTRTGGPR